MSLPPSVTEETSNFPPCQAFRGHTGPVTGVIHLPGGQQTLTSSRDGSLRLWNVESGLQIGEDWRDADSPVLDIALSPNGNKVVSGSEDGAVRLWDIHAGKMIAKWTGHSRAVDSVCWSEEGRRVVSGCYRDGTAMEWDVDSGTCILGPLKMELFMQAFAYSPKKAMIAVAGIRFESGAGKISEEIWDVKTRKLVTCLKIRDETLTFDDGITRNVWNVCCLAWTADGEKLVSGTHNAIVIRNSEWEEIAYIKIGCYITSIGILPNARILAFASRDGGGWVNLENHQIVIGQRDQPTTCVSFSTDGKLLSHGYCPRHRKESNPPGVDDYVVCTYDVVATLQKLGLKHLLLDKPAEDDDKPVLDADATRAAVQQPENVRRRLRADFFDDTRDYTRTSPSHLSPRPSVGHDHAHTLSAPYRWLFSLLSRSGHTARERQTLDWTRALFSGQLLRRDQPYGQRRLAVVETPYTRGQDRNVKVTRESKGKTPASSNIMTLEVPDPSRPQNSGSGQQSSGDGSGHNLPLPSQLAVNATPAAATATATTSAAATPLNSESTPDTMAIRQVGCWTRFWLSLGCISAKGQH